MKVTIGNLFEGNAKTIVNTVNCVGVMGKGIAQEFKARYPAMYKDYVNHCEAGKVQPGVPYLFSDMLGNSILNFPTKKHWRSPSKLEDIIHGLDIFVEKYKAWGIESIAFPPLGCGNGGLDWEVVGPIMYQKLLPLDIDVEIYAPFGTKREYLSEKFLASSAQHSAEKPHHKIKQKITPGLIAVLEALHQLEKQPYANPVGRTIFQKICYIMTEQGVPTGFQFRQGSYGPFSAEVKDAINVLANSNLIYEFQLGRMTAMRTGPEFEAMRQNFAEELRPYLRKVAKTVDLFSRIKDTNQAEEVTTVLYSVRALKDKLGNELVTEQDVFNYIIEWKKSWASDDKKEAIALSIRNLEMLGWMKVGYSKSLSTY